MVVVSYDHHADYSSDHADQNQVDDLNVDDLNHDVEVVYCADDPNPHAIDIQ